METQTPYVTEKKKITVTTKITPAPQDYHFDLTVPFFSKMYGSYFKVTDENTVTVINIINDKAVSVARWGNGATYYKDAVTSPEITEQEFLEAYSKVKQIIESNL